MFVTYYRNIMILYIMNDKKTLTDIEILINLDNKSYLIHISYSPYILLKAS